jgi:hypothetical protein
MENQQRNRRIFISHSNGELDNALVSSLMEKMSQAGFEAVLAEHSSSPMAQLGEKVRDVIEQCSFFLALLTTSGGTSDWIQQELGFAYNYHRRDKTIAVLVQEGVGLGGFYTGLEYYLFKEDTFDLNIGMVISYFERVIRGEVQVTLTPHADAELRKKIDRLRADTKENAVRQLMEHMEPVLDSVITNFATAFQDPELGIMTRSGLDNFFMRTETFVALMDAIQEQLAEVPLDRALYRAGMQAGRTFGADFCDHVLLQNQAAVSGYDDLLKFWLYYDQTSGWSKPQLLKGLPDVLIDIKNSFLVRKSGRNNPHRYCAFIRGYVDGFLQFTMRRVSRYVREAGVDFKDPTYSPRKVEHEAGLEHECRLRVMIEIEDVNLAPAFDHIFKAGLANALGHWLRCVNHCRAAMEFGIKGKLGLTPGDHTSFHAMVKQFFSDERAANQMTNEFAAPKHYRELYGRLSGSIHQFLELGPEECRTAIVAVDEFLCGLERIAEVIVPKD